MTVYQQNERFYLLNGQEISFAQLLDLYEHGENIKVEVMN